MDATPIAWADAHAHLQDARLAAELPGVLARAKAAGVRGIHVNATRPADWDGVRALALENPGFCVPGFGVHPWHVDTCSVSTFAELKQRLADVPSGVGEIGLDAQCPGGLTAAQERWFVMQLELAKEFARPVSIHCRGAWEKLFNVLAGFLPHEPGVLLHSYAGPSGMVAKLAGERVWFSFGWAAVNKSARRLHDLVKRIPIENLLLESDAPDQPPRGAGFSEPADIPTIARGVAALRGESIERIADGTHAGFQQLFRSLL